MKQYRGKQQEKLFKHILVEDCQQFWVGVQKMTDIDEKGILCEAFLKFCGGIAEVQQEWLNINFEFLSSHAENIGMDRCKELIDSSLFNELNKGNSEILKYVIENSRYEINLNNLLIVTLELCAGKRSITGDNLNITRMRATENESFKKYIDSNIVVVVSCIVDEEKDESVESLLYLINHNNLAVSQKEKYLQAQMNRIDDIKDINGKDLYSVAIRDDLVTPTWINVSLYFSEFNELTGDLVGYLERHAHELAQEKCGDSIPNCPELTNLLFLTDSLSINTYSELLKSFTCEFVGREELKNLEKDHLTKLIESGKIPFEEGTIGIMEESTAFAEYIIHYYKKVANSSLPTLNVNEQEASIILQSKISMKEVRKIIKKFPQEVKCLAGLADLLINLFIKTGDIEDDDVVLIALIRNAKDLPNRVLLANKFIKTHTDTSEISQALVALGGPYADMTKQNKRPGFTTEEYNLDLLTTLQEFKYISSFKQEKNKEGKLYYRVFLKR